MKTMRKKEEYQPYSVRRRLSRLCVTDKSSGLYEIIPPFVSYRLNPTVLGKTPRNDLRRVNRWSWKEEKRKNNLMFKDSKTIPTYFKRRRRRDSNYRVTQTQNRHLKFYRNNPGNDLFAALYLYTNQFNFPYERKSKKNTNASRNRIT